MSVRLIILDTETTGLSHSAGHRIVEIGCVELLHGEPSGQTFHQYLNPEREVPLEAFKVHGLNFEFLKAHPTFAHVASDFLAFIQNSPLVIHNARFDMSFLNGELQNMKHPQLTNPVIDTLSLARKRFPGAPVSLDALCRHFRIDLGERTQHGALLDAKLLSYVYREMMGGQQEDLKFLSQKDQKTFASQQRPRRTPRIFSLSQAEQALHADMQEKLKALRSGK